MYSQVLQLLYAMAVVNNIVNYIRVTALKHRTFQTFLAQIHEVTYYILQL